MKTVTEEIRNRLPKILANVAVALMFLALSYIALWTLSDISQGIMFLLQIGLLIVAGIFLIRTSFDAQVIIDKATRAFLRRLGINEEWSRQRIFKDIIYIVSILLFAAAIFPLFRQINSGSVIQEVTTYVALGVILLFVYDIGRTFSRITEKKASSVANRISNSINNDGEKNK